MIAHLRGRLLAKHPNQAIVETGGVGYDVVISVPTYSDLPGAGSEVAGNAQVSLVDVAHRPAIVERLTSSPPARRRLLVRGSLSPGHKRAAGRTGWTSYPTG